MKKMFRKAMTVLGSAALVGATVGVAAAASYPEPFTSNSAIVVGANAAPSDSVAAASIASDLSGSYVGSSVSSSTTVTGGDSYKFEKSSTKFHLGDSITDVISSDLDEDEMPILLNDAEYVDKNNDRFDYTQEIAMGALQLTQFEDNDYEDDVPTIGFRVGSNTNILNYTLTFSEEPDIADMDTSDLSLMGRDYYVLSAAYNTLTLLDSATDTVLSEGETATVTAGGKTYTVSINFISSDEAKLTINGENTNSIGEGQTYKLDDGSYVGVKDILYTSKESAVSKVEFSIGSGKLILADGSTVELNEEDVEGLTAHLVNNSAKMTSVTLEWDADDDAFITEDSTISLPGFGTIQLAFGGLDFPEEEMIYIENDGRDSLVLKDFPLKDGKADINLLYSNGTAFTYIGKGDNENLLVTDANADGNITFDKDTDDYFVASWTDGRDAESYLMRATNFKTDNSVEKATFQYYDGDASAWMDAKSDRKAGDTFSVGNVELAVGVVDDSGQSVEVWNNSAETSFNTLYSAEGLKVFLPYDNVASASGAINITGDGGSVTSYSLVMVEEDKDGDIAQGDTITASIGLNGQSPKEIHVASYSTTNGDATSTEMEDTDEYYDWTYSALATKIVHDQGPNQYTLTLTYHGDEVAADVYITSSDAVISGGSESGIMTFKDNEASSFAGKNLIVVGGSAINSVAADLLGGAYRGDMFTSMTGVGDGEFLIQSFARGSNTALLVAGYNAADTTKAATYLTADNDVDTTVGKKYKGSTAESATLVVA